MENELLFTCVILMTQIYQDIRKIVREELDLAVKKYTNNS